MPTRCVIKGCKSEYPGAVSLHRFPSHPETRTLWTEFVSLQNEKEYNHRPNNRLCGLHFSQDAYIDGDLKFRSVPTEFFFRHETSDFGWYVKPKAVSKPPLQVAENHDQEPDKIQRVHSENGGGNCIVNSDHSITSSSSPAASNLLEEMVDDPDPPQLQVFGSTVETADPIATQSSRLGSTKRKSIEDLNIADLKRLKEIVQDTFKKLECSRSSASMWNQRVSSLKNVIARLWDDRNFSVDIDDCFKKKVECNYNLHPNISNEKGQLSRSLTIPCSTNMQDCISSNPAPLNNEISPAKPARSGNSFIHLSLLTPSAVPLPKEAALEKLAEDIGSFQPAPTNSSVTQGTRSCTLFPRSGFSGNHQPVLMEPNQAIKEEEQSSSSHHPTISDVVRGRRTINFGSTLEKFEKIAQHPVDCPSGRMVALSEDIHPLHSTIRFMCYECGKEAVLETELFS